METSKTSFDRRLFAGLLLIIAGGLLLLDSMNILPLNLRYYIIDWRTLLIFIGIIALSNRENRTTGWILIGIGLIFWLPAFYYIRLRTIFWPVVLIGLGLLILSRKNNRAAGVIPCFRIEAGKMEPIPIHPKNILMRCRSSGVAI